jgi:tRNA-uridine 2-sulfurtransferase
MKQNQHVIVGLSGGVDSAVAAMLLKQQGHRVTALFMKNWEEDDDEKYCSATEDLRDCQAVCDTLDMPLHTVNFASEYWDRVFAHFLSEYKAGRTPNPDVLCNKEIKFKAFLEHALDLGADRIATGHYARINHQNRQYHLLKGKDPDKDQSYFLYLLGQHELGKTIFPIGDLQKSKVREMAKEAGLSNHDRKDSTGICFIGERRFKDFLSQYLPAQPGPIRDVDGSELGQHDGLMYYTIGQRQGLGIGGAGAAWYVCNKDMSSNTLYVAQGEDHASLFSVSLEANSAHWISGNAPALPLSCQAKIRYRQHDQACTIHIKDKDQLHVVFDRPQRAVAPGQSIVFYQGEECLGGATINQAISS